MDEDEQANYVAYHGHQFLREDQAGTTQESDPETRLGPRIAVPGRPHRHAGGRGLESADGVEKVRALSERIIQSHELDAISRSIRWN